MIALPPPDPATILRRPSIAAALKAIVPDGVIADEATLTAFDCDALAAYRQRPLLCVLPENADQVSAVVAYASRENIPIVPRGAGTSLSGGALPLADGILIGLSKFNRILDIDYENRGVGAQPGVDNL